MMCKRIFAYQTQSEGEIPFFKIGTIGSSPDAYISQELFDDYKEKYNYPRVNEVMITCAGTVGRCWQFDGTPSYYQDSNIVWIDNPQGKISNNFIYRILERTDWSKLNSTTITRIYNDNLRNLKCYYPAIEEQNKITDFLSLIDQRIEKQRQLVESLKKYKRGLFKYVFDILSDAPFYPLKDIAELIKGTQLSKINMIKNGKFYVLNGGIIPSGRTNSYNTIANTISISEGGNSCGYVNYNTQPFWSGGHCYTLQNISDFMNERFLWHYLKFQEKNIMMLRIGSGLPNIQKASLLKFLVLVPELKVQNKYAMIFDKIENFENAQFEILKNLNLLKQSLLQQMFI